MVLRANCKINLGLDILHRRADGFHSLETVMIPVCGLYDEVEVNRTEDDEVRFRGVGMVVDCVAEDNLCVRAARLMQSRYGVGGVEIILDKRVPFGAGLGGGSADATAVLLAINEIYTLSLPEDELMTLAAELGSDTAFFVRNTPQLCSGRGEIMEPINLPLKGLTLVLIKPEGVNISTREAYSGVHPATPARPLCDLLKEPIGEWMKGVKNDFEPHIFESHPILAQIKSDLLNAGACYAAMSGSGSTIFGLFDNPTKAKGEQLASYSPYIFTL